MTPDELAAAWRARAARYEPPVRARVEAVLAAFAAAADAAALAALAALIERGDVAGLVALLVDHPASRAALAALDTTLGRVLAASGVAEAALAPPVPPAARGVPVVPTSAPAGVPGSGTRAPAAGPSQARRGPPGRAVRLTFDAAHPATVEAARAVRTEARSALTADLTTVVRDAVTDGAVAGANPRETARAVRGAVDLAPSHVRHVARLEAQLASGDPTALRAAAKRRLLTGPHARMVREAAAGTRRLTAREQTTIVASYRKRYVAWHAETVARTAALDAARAGQQALWDAAIRDGTVQASHLEKRWVTRRDGRERPSHRAMHDRRQPYQQPWVVEGVRMAAPSGWNCRCAQVVRPRLEPVPEAPPAAPTAAPTLTVERGGADDRPSPAPTMGRVVVRRAAAGAVPPSRVRTAPPMPKDLPAVRIRGDELAPASADWPAFKAAAKAKMREFRDVGSMVLPDGRAARVSGDTESHFFSRADRIHLEALPAVPELLRGARLLDVAPPREYADPTQVRAHWRYGARLLHEGRATDYPVVINVREFTDGTLRVFDYRLMRRALDAPTE